MATKFGQKSPNCRLHFCARNRGLFCTNSKVFGVGEFKYAIQNFKGAKRVAMATKFGPKNCAHQSQFSVILAAMGILSLH